MADRIAIMDKGEVMQVATPGGNLRSAGLALRRRLHRQRQHVRRQGRRAATQPAPGSRQRRTGDRAQTIAGRLSPAQAVASRSGRKRSRCRRTRPDARIANAAEGEICDIAYLGDMTVYHVRLDNGQVIKASALNAARLDGRPADLERPCLDLLPARCRRRADAGSERRSDAAIDRRCRLEGVPPAPMSRRRPLSLGAAAPMLPAPCQPAGHHRSLPLAAGLLPRPLRHRLQDLAVADGDRDAALYAGARFQRRRLAGLIDRLTASSTSTTMSGSPRTRSISPPICPASIIAGDLDGADAAGRLPDRLRHGARAGDRCARRC